MNSHFSTQGHSLQIVQEAVEQYRERHGAFGDAVVVASHIDPSTLEAQGFAVSPLDGVVLEVERLCRGIEVQRQERQTRQARLWERYEAGELDYNEWLQEYLFSF